ncbi:Snf7-domain-containing protein [Choiromyces venosus 120613-1]|uniref:Vacuolar-sorting protein SNF7 n=1 Tax=Choiromyces venosus 120613-1 TaxID=1336337 RepID=A0A3N4JWG7_9PEZI|nr:Snf7-domain-containing protein [Choiromyces venosus 120613-1]
MWSWFGRGAANKKDSAKDAILKLREQLEMLQKKEKHLEGEIAEQDSIARKMVQTNKNAAMTALKRKKTHETHLASTVAQINTIEQQMHSIETANLNYETLKVMQSASDAMKKIHGGMNLDKVDMTMEEIKEQQQIAEEIGNAIVNMCEPTDESELLKELDSMKQEQLDTQMLSAPSAPITATPQTTKGKTIEEDEDAELMKLRAEMAM